MCAVVTDFSDAAGMLLLDVENRKWSDEMLKICNITAEQLPKPFESYEKIGTLKADVANLLGLNEDVVVVAGAGDNAAAAIGTATVGDGKCNISLGTSGTVFISSNEFHSLNNNAIHNFCHSDGGYHLMGCILSAASCNKWFCDEVLNTTDYKTEESVITDDMLGANDLFFLPYLMGERSPINDTNATGVFIGLRPNTTRKEMLLAVLEGVIFAIKDCLTVVDDCGVTVNRSTTIASIFNIYRIGNLTWRMYDGKFQKNAQDNGFIGRCKGLLKVRVYSDELNAYPIDFTAVDECAIAFVTLALHNRVNNIYHLYNPNMYSVENLTKRLLIHCKRVPQKVFDKQVKDKIQDKEVAILSFYSSIATISKNITMRSDFTINMLKDLGFTWSKVDLKYLKYLRKMV